MYLHNNRLKKWLKLTDVHEGGNLPKRIMENMLFYNVIIYNLHIYYDTDYKFIFKKLNAEGHVFLNHNHLWPDDFYNLEHSDTFYSNIYKLILEVSRKKYLQRQRTLNIQHHLMFLLQQIHEDWRKQYCSL